MARGAGLLPVAAIILVLRFMPPHESKPLTDDKSAAPLGPPAQPQWRRGRRCRERADAAEGVDADPEGVRDDVNSSSVLLAPLLHAMCGHHLPVGLPGGVT
jgi:hypothetical protein